MLIKSLEQMETIVENNKSLSWDGWTVVESSPFKTAWMQPNAIFKNGKWFVTNRFEAGKDGWNIPSKLVKKNAE